MAPEMLACPLRLGCQFCPAPWLPFSFAGRCPTHSSFNILGPLTIKAPLEPLGRALHSVHPSGMPLGVAWNPEIIVERTKVLNRIQVLSWPLWLLPSWRTTLRPICSPSFDWFAPGQALGARAGAGCAHEVGVRRPGPSPTGLRPLASGKSEAGLRSRTTLWLLESQVSFLQCSPLKRKLGMASVPKLHGKGKWSLAGPQEPHLPLPGMQNPAGQGAPVLVKSVQEGSVMRAMEAAPEAGSGGLDEGLGDLHTARGPKRSRTGLHPPTLEAPWGPLEKASGGALYG